MPRGLSSTTLPAKGVRRACAVALVALVAEREAIRRETVTNYFRAHWWLGSFNRAERHLPEHLSMLYTQYRTHDEACLRALHGLCEAAAAANPNFTVEMTADDFRLIQRFYK